jgi:hypothetical protein
MVRFGFLSAAKWKQNTNLGTYAKSGHKKIFSLVWFIFERLFERDSAHLLNKPLAHAFAAVVGDSVSDFVPHHHGQTGGIFGNGKDTGIDDNFAAGHAPGIDLGVFHEVEFPGIAVQG